MISENRNSQKDTTRTINSISGRLSLRRPQRESLEILGRLAEIIPLKKDRDLAAALDAVKSEFPGVESFERDFPSLCFALATGVGKTRLMGAFITFLYLVEGKRNFFVLAPNLTIYEKLIKDFTPNTPKYVFQGIAEFSAAPPFIVTGENYDQRPSAGSRLFDDVQINIFNISKINAETRGSNSPRIKRLSEYIGESYFDYLAGLDDLVMLMDESHHYRASSGMRAINELNPVLGLELTATPTVTSGQRNRRFANIVYDYPLSRALDDGFVKEPAVATRKNFDPGAYGAEDLDLLKLKDGIRIHEDAKVELQTYASQRDEKLVKPFMLVVAKDISHAEWIVSRIKSEDFFDGRYAGKVIQVDSGQRGAEKEENIQRLLAVEDAKEPTEIVVHVNKLKEGWDVTNLYTIVPLRAARAEILIEQTIGRGLRLPYGKQTGVPAVDRLTIVAHDKFQELIEEANRPDSLIKQGVVIIGEDVPEESTKSITIKPKVWTEITDSASSSPEEKRIATIVYETLEHFEQQPNSKSLSEPEVLSKIVYEVSETYTAESPETTSENLTGDAPQLANIVEDTVKKFQRGTIDIPRIVVLPEGETTFRYEGFVLDLGGINYQPVDQAVLIHHLHSSTRHTLFDTSSDYEEVRPEDYIVRSLIDYDDISYDENADLLYELAGQTTAHFASYLTSEEDVMNVAAYYEKQLARFIYARMRQYQTVEVGTGGYEVRVSRGFSVLKPNSYTVVEGEEPRNFRAYVEAGDIRKVAFGGFSRCLYEVQKFDSRSEKVFAGILEDDPDELVRWLKPAMGEFRIFYDAGLSGERNYNPDFVVETASEKLIIEVKRESELETREVQDKAKAAATWCGRATSHALENGGKSWRYLLVPDSAITSATTLKYLTDNFEQET